MMCSTVDYTFSPAWGNSSTHLFRVSPHESQDAVLVVLEVCIEQRRPSPVITTLHLVLVSQEGLHTLHPPRHGSQVKGRGTVIVLQHRRGPHATTKYAHSCYVILLCSRCWHLLAAIPSDLSHLLYQQHASMLCSLFEIKLIIKKISSASAVDRGQWNRNRGAGGQIFGWGGTDTFCSYSTASYNVPLSSVASSV